MTRKLPPLPPGARPATDDEILRFLIWDGYVNIISPRRANGTWVGGDRVSKRLYAPRPAPRLLCNRQHFRLPTQTAQTSASIISDPRLGLFASSSFAWLALSTE